MANDLDKHSYLTALQERNESLFYKVVSDNIEELLPIIHMPTVSQYCAKFSLMFRSLPRALFISMKDKGRFRLVGFTVIEGLTTILSSSIGSLLCVDLALSFVLTSKQQTVHTD